MSEMEELKKNADKQKVIERMNDISKYLDALILKCSESGYWMARGDLLELFVFTMYWVIVMTAIFMDTPEEILRIHTNLAFLVMLIAIYRSWYLHRVWREAEGEWRGAITILELLGMVPPRPDGRDREKKRVSAWEKGAELVKSWGQAKEKARKIFAPA